MAHKELRAAVGLGGTNMPADTEEVRFLLEMNIFYQPRFKQACMAEHLLIGGETLKRDPIPAKAGITGRAVQLFQEKVLYWTGKNLDGRVDPKGKTWSALISYEDALKVSGPVKAALRPTVPDAQMYCGVKLFNQGTYKTAKLGYRYDSNKDKKVDLTDDFPTISQQGCFLCVLTMAATMIGRPTTVWPEGLMPKNLTPIHSNNIALQNRCYTAAGLNPFIFAPLLGMNIERYSSRTPDRPLPPNPTGQIDGHLASGGVIAAHVDYKNKHKGDPSKGDHWVLITKRAGAGANFDYDAIDPSGGVWMGMNKSGATNMRDADFLIDKLANDKDYRPAVLYGNASSKSSKGRQGFQNNYRMVRYCLLSRRTV